MFFQPFPLNVLEYNERLLYVTGFGGITFFISLITVVIIPYSIPKWFNQDEPETIPAFLLHITVFVLNAVAFAFYLKYVGKTPLSLYVLFKLLLVCLLPIIILIIINKNRLFAKVIDLLKDQNKSYLSKLNEYETFEQDNEIEIKSANKSDNLILKYKNIIAIKSADNYIEIFYLENDTVRKKLIRNTLKNIENQLSKKRCFIRCHRTGIINIMHIEKLVRTYNGYNLKMSYLEETIPVSRQYLMKVREAISSN